MIEPTAGAALGPLTIDAVGGEAMRHMAAVLGDPNPIHLDAAAAQAAGVGDRPVNQGPINMGYLAEMLLASAPGAELSRLRVRLLGRVLEGDRVTAAGRVDAAQRLPDGRWRLECAAWLDVDGGGRAVEGTAILVVDGLPT